MRRPEEACLATLRRFLREGTPWRSLRASEDEASGSTLRRTLAHWAAHDVLAARIGWRRACCADQGVR